MSLSSSLSFSACFGLSLCVEGFRQPEDSNPCLSGCLSRACRSPGLLWGTWVGHLGEFGTPPFLPQRALRSLLLGVLSLATGRGLRRACPSLRSLSSARRGRGCAPPAAAVWPRTTVSALLTEALCLVGETLLPSQLLASLSCPGLPPIAPARARPPPPLPAVSGSTNF